MAKAEAKKIDPAPEAALFGDEAKPAASGWLPIPETVSQRQPAPPHDGQPVWLTPDGERATAAYWKTTSELNLVEKRRVRVSFWAVYIPGMKRVGGQRVMFEPIGWKPYEENAHG